MRSQWGEQPPVKMGVGINRGGTPGASTAAAAAAGGVQREPSASSGSLGLAGATNAAQRLRSASLTAAAAKSIMAGRTMSAGPDRRSDGLPGGATAAGTLEVLKADIREVQQALCKLNALSSSCKQASARTTETAFTWASGGARFPTQAARPGTAHPSNKERRRSAHVVLQAAGSGANRPATAGPTRRLSSTVTAGATEMDMELHELEANMRRFTPSSDATQMLHSKLALHEMLCGKNAEMWRALLEKTSVVMESAGIEAKDEERKLLGVRRDNGSAYVHNVLLSAQRLLALEGLAGKYEAANAQLQDELTVQTGRAKSLQEEVALLRDALVEASQGRARPASSRVRPTSSRLTAVKLPQPPTSAPSTSDEDKSNWEKERNQWKEEREMLENQTKAVQAQLSELEAKQGGINERCAQLEAMNDALRRESSHSHHTIEDDSSEEEMEEEQPKKPKAKPRPMSAMPATTKPPPGPTAPPKPLMKFASCQTAALDMDGETTRLRMSVQKLTADIDKLQDSAREVEALESKLQKSATDVKALTDKLQHSTTEVENFKDKWQNSAKELDVLLERLQKTEGRARTSEKRVKELEKELAAAQKEVKDFQDAVKIEAPISPIRKPSVDAEVERLRKQATESQVEMEKLRATLAKSESDSNTEIARLREMVATSAARYAASLNVATVEVNTSVDRNLNRSLEIKVPPKVHTRGTQTYVVLETNLIDDSIDGDTIKELQAEVAKLKAQIGKMSEKLKQNEAESALLEANYKRRLDEASKNAEKLRQSVSLAERLRKREEELRINEIAKTTEIVKKLKEEIEALKAQLGIREGMSGMLSQKSLEHEWEELKKSRAAVLKLQADLEAEAVTMRSMNVLTKSGVMKFDLASGVTGTGRPKTADMTGDKAQVNRLQKQVRELQARLNDAQRAVQSKQTTIESLEQEILLIHDVKHKHDVVSKEQQSMIHMLQDQVNTLAEYHTATAPARVPQRAPSTTAEVRDVAPVSVMSTPPPAVPANAAGTTRAASGRIGSYWNPSKTRQAEATAAAAAAGLSSPPITPTAAKPPPAAPPAPSPPTPAAINGASPGTEEEPPRYRRSPPPNRTKVSQVRPLTAVAATAESRRAPRPATAGGGTRAGAAPAIYRADARTQRDNDVAETSAHLRAASARVTSSENARYSSLNSQHAEGEAAAPKGGAKFSSRQTILYLDGQAI